MCHSWVIYKWPIYLGIRLGRSGKRRSSGFLNEIKQEEISPPGTPSTCVPRRHLPESFVRVLGWFAGVWSVKSEKVFSPKNLQLVRTEYTYTSLTIDTDYVSTFRSNLVSIRRFRKKVPFLGRPRKMSCLIELSSLLRSMSPVSSSVRTGVSYKRELRSWDLYNQ